MSTTIFKGVTNSSTVKRVKVACVGLGFIYFVPIFPKGLKSVLGHKFRKPTSPKSNLLLRGRLQQTKGILQSKQVVLQTVKMPE